MVLNPAISCSSTSRLLVKASPFERATLIRANSISTRYPYDIESKQQTSSASLLFARHRESQERVVIKILREHQDTRYNLKANEERQRYQVEALHWNSLFAPQVYVGLAQIRDWSFHQKTITLSEIILNPKREQLDPKAEYALVMHELPFERRLDVLLNNKDVISCYQHLQLLTEYVAYMHNKLVGPPVKSEHNLLWGSFEQLHQKLQDNLALLDLVITTGDLGYYSSSNARGHILSQLLPQDHRRSPGQMKRRQLHDVNLPGQIRDILDR
jgi:hypothetical protein